MNYLRIPFFVLNPQIQQKKMSKIIDYKCASWQNITFTSFQRNVNNPTEPVPRPQLALVSYRLRCTFSVLCCIVRSTARHTIHLPIDISTNALEIRAIQSPKRIVRCVINCTYDAFSVCGWPARELSINICNKWQKSVTLKYCGNKYSRVWYKLLGNCC
jgi:hypothetical protein